MYIVIGSDHAGYELKEHIKKYLSKVDCTICDVGTYTEESCDYPDIADKIRKKIVFADDMGIAICGTGIGISMACNRFTDIRCALCHNSFTGKMAREHNNANILALGAKIVSPSDAIRIIHAFLNTEFEGGRHQRRLRKLH